MRKIITAIVALGILALAVAPAVVYGQGVQAKECCKLKRSYPQVSDKCQAGKIIAGPGVDETTCPLGKPDENFNEWGTCCLLDVIYNVTDWIFYILLSLVVLLGIVAGVMFMTAAGNPEKVGAARNLIVYTIIGLVVAVLAKVIPSIVLTVIS